MVFPIIAASFRVAKLSQRCVRGDKNNASEVLLRWLASSVLVFMLRRRAWKCFRNIFIAPSLPIRIDQAIDAPSTSAPAPPNSGREGGSGLSFHVCLKDDDQAELGSWR